MDFEEYKKFIRVLAAESARIIKPWFFNPDLQVNLKGDETPVTIADRQAEEVLRDLIRRTYPAHGIIGEEFGEENPSAEFVWLLDPIDGTKTFISGCPLFGTIICLLQAGKPVLGAINLPVLDQFCIGDSQQTTVNNKPVQMRAIHTLSEATLLATDVLSIGEYQNQNGFDKLLAKTKFFRTWGDCYGYMLLAAGWADIMLDPIMNPWDLLALIPIIQGAGGVITTWQGEDAATGNSCIAANKQLHSRVVEILNS